MQLKHKNIEILFQGDQYSYFQGITSNNEQILLKSHNTPTPNRKILESLYQEEKTLSQLPNTIGLEIQEVSIQDGQLFSIYKYRDIGTPLGLLFHKPYSEEEQRKIIVAIIQQLKHLHEKGWIHKNLTPWTITYNPLTKNAKFLDFELAEQLSTSPSKDKDAYFYQALPYISPEQTGYTQGGLDERSDLYMLGSVFYHFLTGNPLIDPSTDIEQIYFHLTAKIDQNVLQSNQISPSFQQLLLGLLQKDPQFRFQSAEAVLRACNTLKQGTKIDRLSSGHSLPIEKIYIQPYPVIQDLNSFIKKQSNSGLDLLLLWGDSGLGKSRMVEFLKQEHTSKVFLKGTGKLAFQEWPYWIWSEILNQLVNHILGVSQLKVKSWRAQVLAKINGLEHLLLEVFPRLNILLNHQPEEGLKINTETKNSLFFTFESLLEISQYHFPDLIIVLEDIQYIDPESAEILSKLITRKSILSGKILLTTNQHQPHFAIPQIQLSSFNSKMVQQWLAKGLQTSFSKVEELANVLTANTEGNPRQILKTLNQAHQLSILIYDQELYKWSWDLNKIQRLFKHKNKISHSDEFPSIWSKSLNQLNAFQQFFSIELAQKIVAEPLSATFWDYLEAHECIEKIDQEGGVFLKKPSKLWDQVAQTTSDQFKQKTHSKIIDLFDLKRDELSVYEIQELALQYEWQSHIHPEFHEKLLKLNIYLGELELERYAYHSAKNYFRKALKQLQNLSLKVHNTLALRLYQSYAFVAYQKGEFDLSIHLTEQLLKNINEPEEGVDGVIIKIESLKAKDRLDAAIDFGLDYLRKLGIAFPSTPNSAWMGIQFMLIFAIFRMMGRKRILGMSDNSSKKQIAAAKLMLSLGPSIHIQRPQLLGTIMVEQLKLVLRNGHLEHSPYLFANLGMVLSGPMKSIKSGYLFGEISEALIEQQRSPVSSHIRALFSLEFFIFHWSTPLSNTIKRGRAIYEMALKYGDFEYATYAQLLIVNHSIAKGISISSIQKDLWHFVQQSASFTQIPILSYLKILNQFLSMSSKKNPIKEDLSRQIEIDQLDKSGKALYYLYQIKWNYLIQDYASALNFHELRKPIESTGASTVFSTQAILFTALSWSAFAENQNNQTTQNKARKYLKKAVKQFKRWAKQIEENFSAAMYLLSAELASTKHQFEKARSNYEKAIKEAVHWNNTPIEAISLERLADLHTKAKNISQSDLYRNKARERYFIWGFQPKVQQLDQMVGRQKDLDLQSLLEASEIMIGSIQYEALLKDLLKIIITNLGAQDGLMLVQTENGWDLFNYPKEVITYEQGFEQLSSDQKKIIEYVNKQQFFYLSTNQFDEKIGTKSVLCYPLTIKSDLVGLLYLEGPMLKIAFQEKHIDFLQTIGGQMAVAIRNGLLYRDIEQAVQKRTKVLEKQNQEINDQKQQLETFLSFKEQALAQKTELQKKEIEALEQQAEIDIMNAAYNSAEAERLRLSEELHHSVSSSLTAISLHLEYLANKQSVQNNATMQKVLDLLGTASQKVREVSHQLAPFEVHRFGFFEAILLQLEQRKTATLDIQIKINSFSKSDRFEEKKEVILYHAVLELVNNASRHGKASQISIQIQRQEQKLSLEVIDNGRGFPIDQVSSGFGLTLIKSRITSIGGTMSINSALLDGTTVKIILPVQVN